MRIFLFFIASLSVLLLTSINSLAQLKYFDGFIVNNKEDTIRGSIGINVLTHEYSKCHFKEINSAIVRKYTPNDIKAYVIPSVTYFFSTNEIDNTKKDKVFAQILVEGKVTLIRYENDFFIKQNGEIIKLAEDYKKVLGEIMKECRSLEYNILLAKKENTDLTEIVSFYNDFIKSPNNIYNYQPPNFIIRPCLGFGLVASQLSYSVNTRDGKEFTNHSLNQQLRGGLAVNLILTKLSRKFSLNVGAFYSKSEYLINFNEEIATSYSNPQSFGIYEQTDISFSSIDFPITIRYDIPIRTCNFYIKSGIANHFIFDQKSSTHIEQQVENVVETNPFENSTELRSSQQGLIIGGGIEHLLMKRWSIGLDINAELANSLYKSENENYSIKTGTKSVYTTLFLKF